MTTVKYIRTEPPVVLTEPVKLTLTFSGRELDLLNRYRQAQHAYFAAGVDAPEYEAIERALWRAGYDLASSLDSYVSHALGESSGFVPVES